MSAHDGLIIQPDTPLYETLDKLAREARLVFFAGLPGTGKSLLINQLTHLAHTRGRKVELLQWDIARPAFETSAPGQRYPQQQGVTHGLIRLAVGQWARQAIAQWHTQHADHTHLLIGEMPVVGHRLVELALPTTDAAEAALSGELTRFVIPVPSRAVRQHLEAERERRAQRPLHQREREDAPPHVLRDMWQQLVNVARELKLAPDARGPTRDAPFDPMIYQNVFAHVLRRRRTQVIALDVILPTTTFSAYNFSAPVANLMPSAADIARCIHDAEIAYPDPARLQQKIERWYVVE